MEPLRFPRLCARQFLLRGQFREKLCYRVADVGRFDGARVDAQREVDWTAKSCIQVELAQYLAGYRVVSSDLKHGFRFVHPYCPLFLEEINQEGFLPI